ncbi:MAG: HAMP domain-containing sensor histidine kinase [Dysgonamonadaceae bacterium]|nr:HAMP domain-containing sensor histidine kinase [Dysgonamonadaceae bacterium]MDD4727576.1 HAMP domain-containing sensor histidine kinase [Dysgonamonadaceae bacterium]
MKKSTIWMLAGVMIVAFVGLLFLQVKYIQITLASRNEQFDETVKRSLYQVSRNLEMDQTLQYIEEDIIESEKKYSQYNQPQQTGSPSSSITKRERWTSINPDGSEIIIDYDITTESSSKPQQGVFISPGHGINTISKTSYELQQAFSKRYLHEKALQDEVILKIMYRASTKPIEERVDFRKLNSYIRSELLSNAGLSVPFSFQVVNPNNRVVYSTPGYPAKSDKSIYTQILFPNDPPAKLNYLRVYFPTKGEYVFSELSFVIPSLIFTVILLITFIFTIITLFRQKRLSEMKNDFINNMTHELKTPVSTISLAAQMLKDASIAKSPEVFKHVTSVINDETKRLSFQVEKVLQMSLFDKQRATLKMKEKDANDLVVSVANTHVLKVEKFGGTLDVDLKAEESTVKIDEMHFTNVLFNLLDNAIKYRKEDVPLKLLMSTWNETGKLFISIEDNGIGIKKEYVKKVFERFYRIPTGNVHDVKGFGLGLAYVHKIVADHGGTIRAESELSKGTKFIISLPLIT